MVMPSGKPVAELVMDDGKTCADLFHSVQACKVFRKDAQDKEQPVTGIQDNKIGKYCVCTPAGTDDTQDTEIMTNGFSMNEVNKGTSIIGMDTTGTLSAAVWTGSKFWAESVHKGIKKGFR